MIGIYVRVSTINQKDNISYQTQEEDGISYAKSVGDTYRVYKEAQSGKKVEQRTEFQRLLSDIEHGKIKSVYVYNQDRIARNTIDGLNFIETLKKHSVKLIINGKEWDYEDSSTYMILTVIFATAEKSGSDIVTYGKERLHAKINRGEQPFSRLFGYRFSYNPDGSKKWEVDENEAEIVRYIYEMFFSGKSFNSIKDKLNDRAISSRFGTTWTTSQVCRVLKKPVYTGWVYDTHGKMIKSKVHSEEIITLDQWKRAQKLWNQRINHDEIFRYSVHLASTLVKCGVCGSSYIHRWQKWGRPKKAKRQYFVRHKVQCKKQYHHVDADKMDDILTALYLHEFQDYQTVTALFTQKKAEIEHVEEEKRGDISAWEKQLESLKKEKQNLITAIQKMGMDNDIMLRIASINSEVASIESKMTQATKDISKLKEDFESMLDEFSDETMEQYLEADDAGRNRILANVIDFASITNGVFTLRFITGSGYAFKWESVPEWLLDEVDLVREFRNEPQIKEAAQIAVLRGWDEEIERRMELTGGRDSD